MNTKHCRTCDKTKPCSDFHIRAASADGLAAKCRLCAKEYDKRRDTLPHRVSLKAAYQKTERGKASIKRTRIKYKEMYPKRRAAHVAVGNALRDGKIKSSSCEVCGNPKAQAHHDDYNKPLDVRWLCTTHHSQWHKENKPID